MGAVTVQPPVVHLLTSVVSAVVGQDGRRLAAPIAGSIAVASSGWSIWSQPLTTNCRAQLRMPNELLRAERVDAARQSVAAIVARLRADHV